jgi:hypothetical protein
MEQEASKESLAELKAIATERAKQPEHHKNRDKEMER